MSLWSRLFAAKPAAAGPAPTPVLLRLPRPASATPAPTFARRPLVDAQRRGRRFRIPPRPGDLRRHAGRRARARPLRRAIALLAAMRSTLAASRIALGELPAALLARSAVMSRCPMAPGSSRAGRFRAGRQLRRAEFVAHARCEARRGGWRATATGNELRRAAPPTQPACSPRWTRRRSRPSRAWCWICPASRPSSRRSNAARRWWPGVSARATAR